jgi:hypothetical protein
LTSITIPDGVTSIENDAFFQCSSLTSITIPDSVTSIGERAFYNCTKLTNITIPDSVTSIGERAFGYCTSLTSIIFQGAAPTVGINAFSDVADGAEAIVTIEVKASFGVSGEKWNNLTVRSSAASPQLLEVQLAQMTAERDAAIAERDAALAERDALPTQASYDTAITERDARFTEDQIHAMSADSTIGMNDEGNVEMKINFFESADLVTFAPFTVTPESVSVVDGNIWLEFTPRDAAFFRFSLR